MAPKADTIAAKLAIMMGFVQQPQVDEALKILADLERSNTRLALTHILLKKRFINSNQYRLLNIATRYELDRDEDLTLARFLIKNGWATESQVRGLLAEQEPLYREGKPFPRLGHLLVEGGVLDQQRLEQARKLMGSVAGAVKAGAHSGMVAGVPEYAPKPAQRDSTLRAETLMLEHCRINTRRHVVKNAGGAEVKVYVLQIIGQLDAHSFSDFDAYLEELVSGDRHRLVFNMGKLTYMSSAGMGALSSALNLARGRGGDIRLCELPEDIHKILQLVGLHELIDIYETEEEAIKSFAR